MIYLLYGDQYPMIKHHLKKLVASKVSSIDDFNVVKLDMDNASINDIIIETSMLPLGYDSKVVVVDNASFLVGGAKDEANRLLNEIKNLDDAISVIFVVRNDKIDDKLDIVKFIKENGSITHLQSIEKNGWPSYIRQYFDKKGRKIDNEAIYELANRVDNDLNRFINEANKLMLYKQDTITLLDVTLMVSKPIEDDVFELSNALLRGDNALAISIYRDLQLLGSRSTDTLIPLLGAQFRFMSMVFFLLERGLDKKDIANELNVSEGRVAITIKNARYLSRKQIARVLNNLYNLDRKIKSGQIDRFYGFELFLIDFPN